jgi:hypothetical protein
MRIVEVVPGLLIGTRLVPPADYAGLGVEAIVDLEDWEVAWVPPVPTGPMYLSFPIEDGERVDPAVREVAAFVAALVRSGRRVLVHCTEGLNRSGVVVARTCSSSGGPRPTPSRWCANGGARLRTASRRS